MITRRPHVRRAQARTLAVFTIAALLCATTQLLAQTSEDAAGQPAAPVHIETTRGPVHIEVSLDSDHVSMAEPFDLKVRIDAERDVATAMPKYEGLLGAFEIANVESESVPCDDLHDCTLITIRLIAAIPGDTEIPGLLVAYVDSRPKMDGSNRVAQDQIQLEPIPIVVENSLADIKGPASLPIPFSTRLIYWGLAALALLALLLRWWLRRPKRIPFANVVPQLPPYEWAMRELDRLMADDLIARGMTQEFYYRINLLLRQYIERRFSVMAGEQTSEEFVRSVQSMGALSADQRETLRVFVAACDPVKYARQQPTNDDVVWVLQTAREFIEATRQDAFVTPLTSTPETSQEVSS
ncbi:MAG TPA: hypothetical protein P5081_04170 [Phycisphaerae bacterium]|nr:hypothetical protein [Phycisphaerae bacterium]HRW52057.1 hypothetical protein [Phycisphaerae bacterium]